MFPGALYWHCPGGRKALLAAAAGHAVSAVLPFEDDSRPWQEWLRALFRRYRAVIRAHPNVAPVLGGQLLSNTNIDFALVERVLSVLARAGFSGPGLAAAYNVTIAAMVGFVTLEFAPLPVDDPAAWRAAQRARTQMIDPDRYPTLARAMPDLANRAFILRWQNGSEMPLDDSFDAYVDTVIDGLACRLR